MKPIADWLERSMTALAFWVGYTHAKFGWYDLPEGAAVTEAWSLIAARLGPEDALLPEVAYSRLERPTGEKVKLKDERVDMAVVDRIARTLSENVSINQHVKVVLEVKRWTAPKKLIDEDLDRLAASLRKLPKTARAFVIVVSEGVRPSRYVTGSKMAKTKVQITRGRSRYCVRRVVKALSTAALGSKSGHYVCLGLPPLS